MPHRPLVLAALFVSLVAAGASAQAASNAGEAYGSLGTTGVLIGWGLPVSQQVKLRVDASTLGNRSERFSEEGVEYDGRLKVRRLGLFADWFPGASGFRLTGGVTYNDIRVDATSRGSGGSIELGGTTYAITAADRFDVSIRFPRVMPYFGIGWGLHPTTSSGRGWGLNVDLGASIGKPKVRGGVSGPLGALVSQADVDRELTELHGRADDYGAWPQLSIGLSLRY